MNPWMHRTATLLVLAFAGAANTAQAGDVCGLDDGRYRVENTAGGSHVASDDAADMTVNATENTWRLAGSSFTAEGHFYAAAGDCAVNMLYGLVEIPGANCDHAIFISGTENWDELHATIVDLETSEECSGHQGGEMNELKAILNHNGQVHLVGEGQ